MPLYGKEFTWRNIKMEAHEGNMISRIQAGKGICCVCSRSLFFIIG